MIEELINTPKSQVQRVFYEFYEYLHILNRFYGQNNTTYIIFKPLI